MTEKLKSEMRMEDLDFARLSTQINDIWRWVGVMNGILNEILDHVAPESDNDNEPVDSEESY